MLAHDSNVHVDEQPSLLLLLPSSHCSPESNVPSPQYEGTVTVTGKLHVLDDAAKGVN